MMNQYSKLYTKIPILNINYNNEELYFECVLDMELPNNNKLAFWSV